MSMSPLATQADTGYKDLQLIEETLTRCNCLKIGRIVSFDTETCSCEIELLEKKRVGDGFMNYPVLSSVPLVIQGNNSSTLTFGDPTGTTCLVFFNDTELSKWWITNQSYETDTYRKHALSDGFAILRPLSKADAFVFDAVNTVLKRGETQVVLGVDKIEAKTQTTSVLLDSDSLIEIKNTAQSLGVIMQALLTACENIATGPDSAPVPLTTSAKQAFTAVKTNLQGLLK